ALETMPTPRSESSSSSSDASDGGDRDQDEAEGGPRPAKRGRFAVPSCVTCLFEGLSESGRAALADAVEVRVRIGKGIRLRILEASPEQQGRLVEQAVDEAASSSSGPGALEPPPSSAPQLDPYGSALWPSALVLSQAVVAHAAAFRSAKAKPSSAGAPATGLSQVEPELQLLELGAGCGLAALTAATLGLNVLATDFRDLPLELLAASARRHGLGARLKTELFDICDLSVPLPAADLVMASDVLYDRQTAIAMAERVAEARRRGSVVLVADCGRPNRDVFLGTLRRILKTEDTVDGLDFNCHGVAVQRVDDSASSFCRKVSVDILELPQNGPAQAFVNMVEPAVCIRPATVGLASLVESTCWTTAETERLRIQKWLSNHSSMDQGGNARMLSDQNQNMPFHT
ncbi:unnamed protein product, partial [Polarella glacialis]